MTTVQTRRPKSPAERSLVVDVFNHVQPKEYVEAVPDKSTIAFDPIVPGSLRDPAARIKSMDAHGVDMEVLSLTSPQYGVFAKYEASQRQRIVRAANDGIARIVEKNPDRFAAVGTVTLIDVGESIDEMVRCVKDLGLVGIQIQSNIGGKPIDSPEFEPFYEKVVQLDTAVFIHPAFIGKIYDWVNEYGMSNTIGFDIDNSMALYRIARGGMFVRHPELKVVAHHMGSLIPFLVARMQRTIMAFQSKDHVTPPPPLKKMPNEYFKMLYVDTAEGAWQPALACALAFFGSGHVMLGSDYPIHGEDDLTDTISSIRGLNISEEEVAMILGGNAVRILGLGR
jgi:predicted TIM-barrel fold metal-dependent hydrolase